MIAQLGHRCADPRRRRWPAHRRCSTRTPGAAPRDIGEALRVDYLVEGSVRVGGDRVRITAQLIETRGETHVWAHSYDRDYRTASSVQTDVAAEIARGARARAVPAGGAAHGGADARARRARGLPDRPLPLEPARVRRACARPSAYYNQAIAHDPSFGRAHSSRARAYRVAGGVLRDRRRRGAAHRRATRPTAPSPSTPTTATRSVVIGEARRVLDHDPAGARAAFEKALALNPSSDAAHRYYAWFLGVRERRRRRAGGLRPGLQPRPVVHRDADVGRRHPLLRAGLRGRAGAQPSCAGDGAGLGSRDALGRGGADPARTRRRGGRDLRRGAGAGAVHGRRSPSRAAPWPRPATSTRPARSPGGSSAPARTAWCRRITSPRCTPRSARSDAAFAQLERACATGDPWLDAVGVDPRFAALHGDDRLHAIRARLRLD